MQDNRSWDFYFCTLAGKPASVKLNLSLIDKIPLVAHSQLVYLFIRLNNPDREGRVHPDEVEEIKEIEEDIVRLMTVDMNGVFAVRCTGNGRRSLYFYLPPHPDITDLIKTCMYAHPDYTYSLGELKDNDWRFFRSHLHPQLIQGVSESRETYLQLSANTAFPQEIEHHLRFPSIEDRDMFIHKISNDQFAISKEKFSATEQHYPFELTISRLEYNHLANIQKIADNLTDVARRSNGVYQDWTRLNIKIE